MNVFVRFSGCNLRCSADGPEGFDCDTEFTSGVKWELEDLIQEIRSVDGGSNWVILTGGEPGLQIDQVLVCALHDAGFMIAIETNGTKALPKGIDWTSCSPKTAEHTLRVGKVDELRYVRNSGQGIPRPSLQADHHFLSPAATADGVLDRPSLAHVLTLISENPDWRISVQQHKAWSVR
jgi:organic radical activating enzyme